MAKWKHCQFLLFSGTTSPRGRELVATLIKLLKPPLLAHYLLAELEVCTSEISDGCC